MTMQLFIQHILPVALLLVGLLFSLGGYFQAWGRARGLVQDDEERDQ